MKNKKTVIFYSVMNIVAVVGIIYTAVMFSTPIQTQDFQSNSFVINQTDTLKLISDCFNGSSDMCLLAHDKFIDAEIKDTYFLEESCWLGDKFSCDEIFMQEAI